MGVKRTTLLQKSRSASFKTHYLCVSFVMFLLCKHVRLTCVFDKLMMMMMMMMMMSIAIRKKDLQGGPK